MPAKKAVLEEATDWDLQFDITVPAYEQVKERAFPDEILAGVSIRPDGVIWSRAQKIVIWIELTSPWEQNMVVRHFEKKGRYNQLAIDCESKGWRVLPICVEVGCRGHVGPSFHYMCKVLGFTKQELRDLKYVVETTAQHCSHSIVAARYQQAWEEKPLLDISKWH